LGREKEARKEGRKEDEDETTGDVRWPQTDTGPDTVSRAGGTAAHANNPNPNPNPNRKLSSWPREELHLSAVDSCGSTFSPQKKKSGTAALFFLQQK
jgi:hypothetical protein